MAKAKVHFSAFGSVRFCTLSLLVFMQFLQPLRGASFLNDAVSYDPPIPMLGARQSSSIDNPSEAFKFRTNQTPDGYAEVTFSMTSILDIGNRTPKEPIKSIADLKKFADVSLSNNPNVKNVDIKTGQFQGRGAVIVNEFTPSHHGNLATWDYGLTFFWHHDLLWEKSSVFSIYVKAEKREILDKLVESLKRVKIDHPDRPPVLAKDAMQLGLSNVELVQRCGFPLVRQGSNEIYITEKFVIYGIIDYRGGSKLVSILYSKVRDPQKAASTAEDRDALLAMSEPMTKAEAQEILERHKGKREWTSMSDNRWNRSDGAVAALTDHGLALAAAEKWLDPRLKK
jgi:hypothetical protein